MNSKHFFHGIKKGLPIAFGYIPIALTFGMLAKINEIPTYISLLMSGLVFAGASQFVALNLLAINTNYWQIVVTIFIINFRHFLMSASLARGLAEKSTRLTPLISFSITDETFSLISLNLQENKNPFFLLGINTSAYLGWVSGTFIGSIIGKGLPDIIQTSMGIALYAMFIGLLIPSIKKSKEILYISIISLGISSLLYWGPSILKSISEGWKIILTTILVCLIGALIFPEVTNNE